MRVSIGLIGIIQRHQPGCLATGVFLLSLSLYVSTLAPGLLWGGGDFAIYQTLAILGKPNVEGGVFAHPLWVVLAHPFTRLPLRDPAWRANFASAVFAAVALSLLFLSCLHIGFLKGLGYALTHPLALLKGVGWGILLGVYQFPLTALVGLFGLYVLWQRDRAAGLLVFLAILGTWAFLLGALDPRAGGVYVWNLHYYLQAYVPFALAIAAGLQVLWERFCPRLLHKLAVIALGLLLPIVVYAVAPHVARHFISNLPDFRPLPGRDNLTYVLSPWKHHETGARSFGAEVLRTLPPNSVLFADYSLWAIFNYLQVIEGARPDVTLVILDQYQAAVIREYRSNPNLFLADTYRYYDLEGIQQHFEIVPAGLIYRLVPR